MPDSQTTGVPVSLYFGCSDANRTGHYLHDPSGARLYHADFPGFPWTIGNLDTGLLKNGCHPDVEDGRVFWTCGGKPELWFAFIWWDNSGDRRGGSNSGFYVRGFGPKNLSRETAGIMAVGAFRFACEQWPRVVKRQRHPLVLQGVPVTDLREDADDGELHVRQ